MIYRELLEEYLRRRTRESRFNLDEYCFDKQLQFIRDPSKRKSASCSRRAGKTIACGFDLVDTALSKSGVNCVYITLDRRSAKRIIWKELLKINRDLSLGAKIDNQDLTITFPNESVIYLSGAKDSSQIEKFRGMAIYLVYIDEAQAFKSYINDLIEDVLEPALFDYDGTLCLTGTPNAVCAGAFYNACHDLAPHRGFSHHHWTIHDNPHIERKSGKKPEQLLAELRQRKGITEDDPTYKRESLGLWVKDLDALVYKFLRSRNATAHIPKCKHHVMGVDLGYDDADAIFIWGWDDESDCLYGVDCFKASGQSVTALAGKIKELTERYNPVKSVIDTGGLGKKVTEELRSRHGVYLTPAEKTEKSAYIELMNDDFRRGRLKVHESLDVIEEWEILQWDANSDPARRKEDPNFENHLCDAALYAWREAKHYTYFEDEKLDINSDEYMDELERIEAEELEEEIREENDEW